MLETKHIRTKGFIQVRQQFQSGGKDSLTAQRELSDQVKLAIHLHAEDAQRLQAVQERLAATEAVGEMGIPAAYMEQAAAELAARRVASAKRRRRPQAGIAAGAVAVAAVLES